MENFVSQKSPKVLVLGKNGMLGKAVFDFLTLQKEWTVHGTQRIFKDDLFYFNADDNLFYLEEILKKTRYDYVINCIGILKSSKEDDPEYVAAIIRINSLFPQELARIALNFGVRVIHISTDGVFSGKSTEPYLEDSSSDCEDYYGKSKYLGESLLKNAISIRCSIVGRNECGKGLLEWFLQQREGSSVIGYQDQYWNGVSTIQFSQLCKKIIEGDNFDIIRKESHVHHFCPNDTLTKYELLRIFKECTDKNIDISKEKSKYTSSRILGTKYGSIKNVFNEKKEWKKIIYDLIKN